MLINALETQSAILHKKHDMSEWKRYKKLELKLCEVQKELMNNERVGTYQ